MKFTIQRWSLIFFVLIVAITIGLKIILFSNTYAFTPDSYYTLRQAQHIQNNFIPFTTDTHTLSNQEVFTLPTLPYIMAIVGMQSPQMGHLVLVSISTFFSLLIFYAITKQQTESATIRILSLLFFASTPIIFSSLTYTLSTQIISMPLLLYLTYLCVQMRKKNINPFLIITIGFVCILIHPITILWIIGYTLYLLVCWIERLNTSKQERELIILLSISSVVWYSIVFSAALREHGLQLLWQNIPLTIRTQALNVLTPLQIFSYAGIVPLALTMFTIFYYTRGQSKKDVLLYIALMFTFLLVSWLTIIPTITAILYFATFMCCLLPQSIASLNEYIQKTRFPQCSVLIIPLLSLALILTNITPAIGYTVQTAEQHIDQKFIDYLSTQKTTQQHTIIIPPQYAHMAIYYTGSSVIMHDNYLFNTHANRDVAQLSELYQARLNADKLIITDTYPIQEAQVILYNRSTPLFAPQIDTFQNNNCFIPQHTGQTFQSVTINCSLVIQ